MTDRERELVEIVQRTREECRSLKDEVDRLWTANAELTVERDVTDELFGRALDLLRQRFGEEW